MTVTTSPLVTAYLADLDRALAGADPGDRAEIVDAVREHIDAALADLGATPSQSEVAGVLRRLGSADAVASAWAVGERTTSPWAPASATPAAPSGPPIRVAPPGMPTWAKALLIVLGVLVAGPVLLALVVLLFLMPANGAGGSVPGWLVAIAIGVLVLASVACLIAAIRSRTHRSAWTVAFVVGLALTITAVPVLGLATHSDGGGVVEQGPRVPVEPAGG